MRSSSLGAGFHPDLTGPNVFKNAPLSGCHGEVTEVFDEIVALGSSASSTCRCATTSVGLYAAVGSLAERRP